MWMTVIHVRSVTWNQTEKIGCPTRTALSGFVVPVFQVLRFSLLAPRTLSWGARGEFRE